MKQKSNRKRLYQVILEFQGKDFSDVEDSSKAFEIISEIADLAGHSAIAEAKAAGLARVFVRDNEIIRLLPDGTEEIIEDSAMKDYKFYYNYKPSTVLHALKK